MAPDDPTDPGEIPAALARRLDAIEQRLAALEADVVPRDRLDAELRRIDHALVQLREHEEV